MNPLNTLRSLSSVPHSQCVLGLRGNTVAPLQLNPAVEF